MFDRTTAVGASLTLVVAMTKVRSTVRPPASVARTVIWCDAADS
ncbi:hypothetical protein ACVWZV_000990 [Bradyrhizobium sp. GM5.1]